MLPNLEALLLTESQLVAELSERPGLIPVSIDPSRLEIIWLDLESYHSYEGFFYQSLDVYRSLRRCPPALFTTSIDVLRKLPLDDSVQPTGFIFHSGRCGSTLLAKVLARSRENLVFSEAAAHNLVWKSLPGCGCEAIKMYRNLVLAMGRRRLASYRGHFIKFTSFNIMRFDSIRAAFPDTPAIFLFNEPGAVLESSAREVLPFLGVDVGLSRIWPDAGAAFADFCGAALAVRDPKFRCLEYSALTPRNLPSILRFLGREPASAKELALMESAFLWDAKSGRSPRRFEPRGPAQPCADSSLVALYRELVDRARSDWEIQAE
jgi:hypothetical protein